MNEIRKIIHPISLIVIPVVILLLYLSWGFIASKNYDKKIEIKKETIINTSDKTEEELNLIFDQIKEKRRTIGEDSSMSAEEIGFSVTSIPFPEELYNKYQTLKVQHQNYVAGENKAKEQGFSYTGIPSPLAYLDHTENNILYSWLTSIFLGLLIGIIISLHPIMQQGIGWILKLALALSPVILIVLGMTLHSNDDYQNNETEKIIGLSLLMYGTLIIAYFVSHRNAHLIKSSKKEKDLYYNYGLGSIFNGFRICLYLFVPLTISLELLTQNIGVGTSIWEIFQNGMWDANTEIFLLSFLIVLFVFKIDFFLLIIQYILKFLCSKKEPSNNPS